MFGSWLDGRDDDARGAQFCRLLCGVMIVVVAVAVAVAVVVVVSNDQAGNKKGLM